MLKYVNKGCTKEEILKAAETVKNTFVDVSVMVMPGLGGKKFYDEHMESTAEVLGRIKPRFLTFMGVNPASSCLYARIMKKEQEKGENRPLTNKELTGQMIGIIDRMPVFRTKIGCFNRQIDAVGHNPLNFGSYNIYDRYDKDQVVRSLRFRLQYRM